MPPLLRCHYAVLDVPLSASASDIRSAYRRLALLHHPDKRRSGGGEGGGLDEEESTARFKEIQAAYEVLSDAEERRWYDNHRDSILRGEEGSGERPEEEVHLWSFFNVGCFSGFGDDTAGFYAVYGDLFASLARQEEEAWRDAAECVTRKEAAVAPPEYPPFGSSKSTWETVSTFFSSWEGFTSLKPFSWCDEYNPASAPNRKVRRLMEEENKKLRKRERAAFNDLVRRLVTFVKKRDPRVKARVAEQARRAQERREAEEMRRMEEKRERLERAKAYEEAEWMRQGEMEDDEEESEEEEEVVQEQLYCIVCKKRFKSDKQWKNHERSKKHLELVAKLNRQLREEETRVEKAQKGKGRERERDAVGDEIGEEIAKLELDESGPSGREDDSEEVEECDEDDSLRRMLLARERAANLNNSVSIDDDAFDAPTNEEDVDGTFDATNDIGEAVSVPVPVPQQASKKTKKKRRKDKKKVDLGKSSSFTCFACGMDFSSKTQLFSHLKTTGHASPIPAVS